MGLALLLVVVGLADLAPARWDRHPVLHWVVTGAGGLVLVLGAVATRDGARGWWALAVAVLGFVGWRVGSRRAVTATDARVAAGAAAAAGTAPATATPTGTAPAAATPPPAKPSAAERSAWVLAFGSLGLALAALVLVGGGAGSWRGPVGPDGSLLDAAHLPGTLLALGVLLVQVATANRVVRLVLDAVGVPTARNEQSLRGGRVLGPLERLLVVGLGLAGQLGAAAVVVAAKGLLRYPELQAATHDKGPTDVSEYFLIGSFVSWLLAIGGALLVLGVALGAGVLDLG